MRWALCVVVALCAPVTAGINDPDIILRRGDANNDGTVNVSDVSTITSWLFSTGTEPPCLNQADANFDGAVDNSDAAYLANWLFQGGPEPPTPGPFATSCTRTSPYLSCQNPSCP